MNELKYKVYIDDNFHLYDEDERVFHKSYKTYERAVRECKRIVDASLRFLIVASYPKPWSAKELYKVYESHGDDPFVMPVDDADERFSAWDYAAERVDKIWTNYRHWEELKSLVGIKPR